MQETWRWFGPSDPITLQQVAQAGATGIVTSLHHIATGDLWPLDEILKRKAEIEAAGLEWSVVESVPLHNNIKLRKDNYLELLDNYRQTLINLGEAGVHTVCYNFMPVVDWTRTNLNYRLKSDARALRFEMSDFIAYDVYMLQRPGAEGDYSAEQLAKAKQRFEELTEEEQALLERNIIAGLPGGEGSYSRETIQQAIAEFIALGTEGYRENLFAFLRDIVPAAEQAGVEMCIHPDDPPFSLFGLPRVVSTEDDANAILTAVPSPSNGLTMCAGSFGARGDNDLVRMIRRFGERIYFVHLRNVKREADGSFYESDHLDGDNDMIGIMNALLDEEGRRSQEGGRSIPMRPDHGHLLAAEVDKPGTNPGYSYGGRMKSLAELRGALHVLQSMRRQ
ncbi:mannonate dehydratase [Pseudomaricurvus sp. HS19]|uniref:mannonate dehydratase n=1 Tax=Pseudomaricurvus sp. HS19 TaxID=2692626 RepID=UPI00136F2B1B|nr:mannonate dehydratase [Pseudomaricurvus sp. HS19]MYM62799.1 mannonate dehydratase [Pseudomaricurvus sp. HS19]